MKETLYTIPLNDAVNADDECPFCFIEREVEQDLLDFALGSGSSYMESDVREATDKAGFCREHFKKMFDYGNTLGNGWILKTHYAKMAGGNERAVCQICSHEIIVYGKAQKEYRKDKPDRHLGAGEGEVLLYLQPLCGHL